MDKLENLKGTINYDFEDAILLNFITKTIKNELEKNGFNPFETSKIEYLKTLIGKYDEDAEIVNEIFKVKNRGDRKLGLRYDLTIPLIKYVSQNIKSIKFPFKRYEMGPVFRDGPIKKGRLREFIQFDFDTIGEKNIQAEAESLIFFFNSYKKLGIKAVLEINNNKILKGALLQNQIKENELDKIILSIDKLKKIGKEEALTEIEKNGFDKIKCEKAIEILESKSFEEIKKLETNDILKKGIEELEILYNLIKDEAKVKINFSMSRGLNIYTGNICEVYDTEKNLSSSIGSGGRYDKVIGDYLNEEEKEIPSFGYSFGIAPIFEILKNKKKELKIKENEIDILLCPLNENLIEDTFQIKKNLIEKGFNCSISYFYNTKKNFKFCESYKIKNICIFGEKEIKEKIFKIKNLESGEETEQKILKNN